MNKYVVIIISFILFLSTGAIAQNNCVDSARHTAGKWYYVSVDTLISPCTPGDSIVISHDAEVEFRGKHIFIDRVFSAGNFTNGSTSIFYDPSYSALQVNEIVYSITDDCPGYAVLDVSGGMPPYSYNWSNGDQNESLTGACAGNYYYIVTDHYGSEVSGEIQLDHADDFFINKDLWVCSDSAITNSYDTILQVALDTTYAVSRTYIAFDNIELPNNAEISSATITLYRISSTGSRDIALSPLYYKWDEDFLFDNAPAHISDSLIFLDYNATENCYTADIGGYLNQWGAKNVLENGFVIKYINEDSPLSQESCRFYSSRSLTQDKRPVLSVNYSLRSSSGGGEEITYTVGPNGDFRNFGDVKEFLRGKTVSQPIFFKVFPKIYTEDLSFDRSFEFHTTENGQITFWGENAIDNLKPTIETNNPVLIENKQNISFQGLDFKQINEFAEKALELNSVLSIEFNECNFLSTSQASDFSMIDVHRCDNVLFVSNKIDTCLQMFSVDSTDGFKFLNSGSVINKNIGNIADSRNCYFTGNNVAGAVGSAGLVANNIENKTVIDKNIISVDSCIFHLSGIKDTLSFCNNQLENNEGKALYLGDYLSHVKIAGNSFVGDGESAVWLDDSNSLMSEVYAFNRQHFIFQNYIEGYYNAMTLDDLKASELLVLDNAFLNNMNGLEIYDWQSDSGLEIIGNLMHAYNNALLLDTVNSKVELMSNTFVTDSTISLSTISLNGLDSLTFYVNNAQNIHNTRVLSVSSLPGYFDVKNNNLKNCSTCTKTDAVSHTDLLQTSNYLEDPHFAKYDEGISGILGYRMTYKSTLLDKDIPFYSDIVSLDMLGVKRDSSYYDVGALESETTTLDGLDIDIELDHGYIFYPNHSSGINQLQVDGLDEFDNSSLNIYGKDASGDYSVLIYSEIGNNVHSLSWNGEDSSSQIVSEDIYKYVLLLNRRMVTGNVYVRID